MLSAFLVPPSQRARDTTEDSAEVEVRLEGLLDAHVAVLGGMDSQTSSLGQDLHAAAPGRPARESFLSGQADYMHVIRACDERFDRAIGKHPFVRRGLPVVDSLLGSPSNRKRRTAFAIAPDELADQLTGKTEPSADGRVDRNLQTVADPLCARE